MWPGEDVEIAVEIAHVDGAMGHRLAAVDQQLGAGVMGEAGDLGDGKDAAEGVGDMGDGHQPAALVDQPAQRREVQGAGIVHRRHGDLDARALAQELPGHDIGVMLQRREDDPVARP